MSYHMVFKFTYFMKFTKDYQRLFQCCGLLGASFTGGLGKHTDDVIMTSLFIFGIRHFLYFVKLVTGYQAVKFQISQLSESNFTEVGIRHHKPPI